MPTTLEIKSSRRQRSLLRDLAVGMRQQMFFWGRDVVHPEGNAFIRAGFEKRPSVLLSGSSIYSMAWQRGVIELHGSQAGWFGPDGGFVYFRTLGRCYRWLGLRPPLPGEWSRDLADASEPERTLEAAAPFLDWWLSFEQAVIDRHGRAYRESCFRHFGRLPKSRSWLPPAEALRWVHGLRHQPESLQRARRFSRMNPVHS